jgi:Golgi phosphoprotein 3 (GPP34)
MLTLSEQFFLLSFNSQKATFSTWHYLTKFDYGLCGALLFELILAEKIMLSEQKEFVVNQAIALDKAWIEDLLTTIEKKKSFDTLFGKKHEKTLLHWIKVLKMEGHIIKVQTRRALKEKQVISEKPAKFLGLKISTTIFLEDIAKQKDLKYHLESVILGKNVPDLQVFMLLRLFKALKVIDKVFGEKTKEEKKILEDKLNLLFEGDEFSEAMKLLLSEPHQEKIEEMTDLFDVLADAISGIGDAMDSVGDGDSGGGDGGGDGGGGGD